MPRLLLECSPQIEELVDPKALLEKLLKAACSVPSVPAHLVKARFFAPKVSWIGPQNANDRAYVFVLFEWLEGRSFKDSELLKNALQPPLLELKKSLPSSIKISITLEVREIPRELHFSF